MAGATVIVVMGVAGAGKTTIGRRLATELGWAFLDADDFHPAGNILKMTRGEPLTDADRAPWLAAMHAALVQAQASRRPVVLAASVLKRRYREQLTCGLDDCRLVYLSAAPELIAQRLDRRTDHFMKADMLASQFATLEVPSEGLTVDAGQPKAAVVAAIRDGLGLT